MMITPPITAEVIENPMKTLACDAQEKQENINQNTYQWWIQGGLGDRPPPPPPPLPLCQGLDLPLHTRRSFIFSSSQAKAEQ